MSGQQVRRRPLTAPLSQTPTGHHGPPQPTRRHPQPCAHVLPDCHIYTVRAESSALWTGNPLKVTQEVGGS